MTQQEIKQIIEAVEKGDESAFNPFFKDYHQKCIFRLRHLTQSEDLANEAFMEAIYKFWKKFVKGTEVLPNNVEGYIFQMAKNS